MDVRQKEKTKKQKEENAFEIVNYIFASNILGNYVTQLYQIPIYLHLLVNI